MNLSEIFTYTDADFTLSEADEAEAIRDAQGGDSTATERLLLAYGRSIRAAISSFKGGVFDGQLSSSAADYGTSSFAMDDVRQAALEGALEAIREHDADLNPRLAGRLRSRVARSLSDEAASRSAFRIPDRTLSRFYGIMREAEGDFETALLIAPEKGMTEEILRAVYAATGAESLPSQDEEDSDSAPQVATPIAGAAGSSFADVEDRLLVEVAFQAVEDDEARICELAYGFTEYEPVPDGEIAHRIGLSRPTVQRKRGKALDKMRKATGALEEKDWK